MEWPALLYCEHCTQCCPSTFTSSWAPQKHFLCRTEAGDQVQTPTQICGVTKPLPAPPMHTPQVSQWSDLQHTQTSIYSESQWLKLKLKIFSVISSLLFHCANSWPLWSHISSKNSNFQDLTGHCTKPGQLNYVPRAALRQTFGIPWSQSMFSV